MKILGSDFDNTLLVNKKVNRNDIEAIKRFRGKGNKFGIVTGRTIGSILSELKKYNIECDFIVGGNGAFVTDGKGNSLHSNYIDKQSVYEIMDYLENRRPNSYILHNGFDIARKVYYKDFDIGKDQSEVSMAEILGGPIGGFFINTKGREQAELIVQELRNSFTDVEVHQNLTFVDITAPDFNKARGISKIGSMFNTNKIWVIGDAQNDLEMLRAYHSFSVEWAEHSVKKMADHVVSGVSEAIRMVENIGS